MSPEHLRRERRGVARILVIDDDANARFALGKMLEGAGHEVRTEADGESGLRTARAALPDMVLLDVRMPGMDGLAVLEKLRTGRKTRTIPVIMLTGVDSDDAMRQSLALYAEAFLSKPISVASLVGTLEHVLAHRPGTDGSKAAGKTDRAL